MFFDHREFSIFDMIAMSEDKSHNDEGDETVIVEMDEPVVYEICVDDASEGLGN